MSDSGPRTTTLRLKRTWTAPQVSNDNVRSNTEHAWILISSLPVLDPANIKCVMGCVTDISKFKWAELIQANAAKVAREAKEKQEKFMDITRCVKLLGGLVSKLITTISSHEIRNPLSAVVQCADSISTCIQQQRRRSNQDDVDELLDEVLDSAETIISLTAHQRRIVDDVLTLSKLESGMMPLALVAADPVGIVQQTLKMFQAELETFGISYGIDRGLSLAELDISEIYCDPARIRQILINLLTNAIKFTKGALDKEIRVSVDASTLEPSRGPKGQHRWFPSQAAHSKISLSTHISKTPVYIIFTVQDSGKGISEEELMGLFNRFAQANIRTHVKVSLKSLL